MKKMVSAVTAVAMTASMLAVAVPASVNALDDTKGLSIRVIEDNGVSVGSKALSEYTIEDNTVEHKLLCGVYLNETTELETQGIQCNYGLQAESVNTTDVTINNIYTSPQAAYYGEAKEYTTADGTTFSTDALPIFSAEVRRNKYTPNAADTYTMKYLETNPTGGFEIPSISSIWTSTDNSKWFGATSDEFPVFYFEIVVGAGAEKGDYIVDFNQYYTDDKHYHTSTEVIPDSKISDGAYYGDTELSQLEKMKELQLTGATITVGEKSQDPTDAPTDEPTDAPTDEPTDAPTQDPTTSVSDKDANFRFYFQDYDAAKDYVADEYVAKPGEKVIVEIRLESALEITGVKCGADFGTLNLDYVVKDATAFSKGVTTYQDGNAGSVSLATTVEKPDGSGEYMGIVPDSKGYVAQFEVTVPEDAADGTYPITFNEDLVEIVVGVGAGIAHPIDKSTIGWSDGAIIVGDKQEPTDEPTDAPTDEETDAPTDEPTDAPTDEETDAPTTGDILLGDANDNGVVNVADVVVLNKYIAGKGELTDQGKINADVNFDQAWTSSDSEAILKAIVDLVELTMDGPVEIDYSNK